jgi:hypothetical protein
MGRLFEMSLRKPLRIRRGGGRVVWGGDALWCASPWQEGNALG